MSSASIWFIILIQSTAIALLGITLLGLVVRNRKLAERALLESEDRLYKVLDHSPTVVSMKDVNGRYMFVNQQFECLFKTTRSKMQGKTDYELFPREFADVFRQNDSCALREKQSRQFEEQVPLEDGIHTYVSVKFPLINLQGDPYAVCVISTDISNYKQVETNLRRTERLLDSVVDSIPHIVSMKRTSDLSFVWMNRSFAELFEVSRQELVGQSMEYILPSELARSISEDDRGFVAEPAADHFAEYEIVTRTGQTRILETRRYMIEDECEGEHYLLSISEDVTETKHAADQLRAARDEAERANMAKSEFLSRMSHELRTPLNSILGFAQLLEMEGLPIHQRDCVGDILLGGRHLLELINEVLDLAKIEAGRLDFSIMDVDPVHVVRESTDIISPLATERHIAIHFEAETWPRLLFRADLQRLKQVILNLLSNAVKYNHPGGKVVISCEQVSANRAQIVISDDGVGIPAEKLPLLFRPFTRLSPDEAQVEGTGLGLALSKGLVEGMNGRIWVESTVRVGSTFKVELDARKTDEPDEPVHATSIWVPNQAPRMHTLLYIEDNLANVRLVERVLSRFRRLELLAAMQGGLGLEFARMYRPSVILLDLNLPDISGQEVLHILRGDHVTKDIPVIVISADATPLRVKELIAAGARSYLTKPLDVKALLRELNDLLGENDQPLLPPADSSTSASR